MLRMCLPPALALALLPALALAQSNGAVEVTQAWSRAALQGHTGVLYATITDRGPPDELVGVDTPVAERAELHETKTENGVMTMRPLGSVPLAPGQPVVLHPGGLHVMLIGLKRSLAAGDSFPATLRFVHAGAVHTTVRVAPAGAAGMDHDPAER